MLSNRFIKFGAIALLLVLTRTGYGQVSSVLKNQIDKIIFFDTEISHETIPGFIIGIIDGDSTFTFAYYDTSLIEVSDSSIYEIGGLTKVFTAHLCHLLAQEDIIDLEAGINQYLPLKNQNSALASIKIRNLITHTSGLMIRPPDLGSKVNDPTDPYREYTKKDVLYHLAEIQHPVDTGKYLYSHLNYAVLEIILEEVTQNSFESLMDQYIFRRSNMYHSYVIDSRGENLSPGFDRSGRRTNAWTFPSFAASEGIKSTATDLIRYMSVQLLNTSNSFKTLLIPAQKIKGTKKTYVAQGWHMFMNKNGNNIYLHSGKTGGHAASIHFVPNTRTAVILLTNSPGKMDGLATLVLRMLNRNWKRKS